MRGPAHKNTSPFHHSWRYMEVAMENSQRLHRPGQCSRLCDSRFGLTMILVIDTLLFWPNSLVASPLCQGIWPAVYIGCRISAPPYIGCRISTPFYIGSQISAPLYTDCQICNPPYIGCRIFAPTCILLNPFYSLSFLQPFTLVIVTVLPCIGWWISI